MQKIIMSRSKPIICPECQGEGALISSNRRNGYESEIEKRECRYCGGRGRMYEKTVVTHERIRGSKKQHPKYEPEWIPVSERLPEIGAGVLIATSYGDVSMDFLEKTREWFWGGGEYTVVAWMPLPEPYEEER